MKLDREEKRAIVAVFIAILTIGMIFISPIAALIIAVGGLIWVGTI